MPGTQQPNANAGTARPRTDAAPLLRRGLEAQQQGRFAEAIEHYRAALELRPGWFDVLNNLGSALRAAGQTDAAITVLGEAIAANPTASSGHYNLANALVAAGREVEAVPRYRDALRVDPAAIGARVNLASILNRAKRHPEAIACLKEGIALSGDSAELWNQLGVVLYDWGKVETAIACYERAVSIDARSEKAHYNLGLALFVVGRYQESIAAQTRAIVHSPEDVFALSNLSQSLIAIGDLDGARGALEKALSLDPDHLDSHLGMARLELLAGDFRRGWDEYEWRWRRSTELIPQFPQPTWTGQPLGPEARLLIWCEQGFGDIVQFARYLPIVADKCKAVWMLVRKPLAPLFREIKGISRVYEVGEKVPPFEFQCPLLSLPRVLGTRVDTIPREVPYLRVPADRSPPALTTPPGTRLKIGITWAGNPSHGNDRHRSCTLKDFLLLLGLPGLAFFSLQRDEPARQLAELGVDAVIRDVASDLGDFGDTAALLTALDLVISVDTAIVHLAGALGRPVWTLLPYAPDWRWRVHGNGSAWYPTMRLFRQPTPGDWRAVFEAVRSALLALKTWR
jgi:tetratricopeptide (TPR) repeat protein